MKKRKGRNKAKRRKWIKGWNHNQEKHERALQRKGGFTQPK